MSNTLQTIDLDKEDSFRRTAMFDYALHIAGILFSLGTVNIVALIINYVRRPASRGTIWESHFTWQIRSFWWTLFWFIVIAIPAMVLSFLTLGLMSFLFVLPAVWFLYRMIKGLLYLNDNKPMPI